MNATAIKPYTAATCKSIIAACERELVSRNAIKVPAWRYAEEMAFRAALREVFWCAIAARDDAAGHGGYEGPMYSLHDALHAALVDLDHYPIWKAAK
jgi:hypothetical protein